MLSQDAIDNLMQPIIERQEAINNYVIQVIAERINEIGTLRPSDVYKLITIYKRGADVRKIIKEISRLTKLNEREIRKLIEEIAKDVYADAEPFYDYKGIPYIPFAANVELQRIVAAVAKQTADTYVNLAQAQAFMLRDRKNPKILKPTSISQTYYSIIDEAVQAVQNGTVDYYTTMRRTMKQLNESGIRNVTYHPEGGRTFTQRLDTAVRRNILDGVREINQGVQDEVGRQFGADGKEISVHRYSAPDHEPVQGHQFKNAEYEKLQSNQSFQDYNGRLFSPFPRKIGTLNCRHFTYSIVLGVTRPNYTQEQLDAFIKENADGYTLPNGKHLTMYECTQYQRKLETKVRRAKDGQMMAKAAGDMALVAEYQAKVSQYTSEYKKFSEACGLSPKMPKMRVSGYKRMKVPKGGK